MREAMLIVHLLGLVMGLGSSFAFMFLSRARSKMEKEEGKKFALNTFAMSRMGHIGITMLIISGLYLMTPFWMTLNARPLLIVKLILVLVLTACIILLSVYSNRAKKGNTESNLKKIAALGKVSLLSGIGIVVLAVLTFH
ncbi:MAG: hypothetical protein IMY68_06650 [Bacteroidetes bacterium]|nr:hypothetical protein [Bacteroidota bacterium]